MTLDVIGGQLAEYLLDAIGKIGQLTHVELIEAIPRLGHVEKPSREWRAGYGADGRQAV